MSDAGTAGNLGALRAQIDAVDRELLALLNRRAELALAVGEIKKHEGSVVFRPEREAQVIDGLKAVNPGPLQTASIAPIWREIMSACRALETPTRVAYLGPAGTFSELAALGYFGSSIVRVPCASIDEVFRSTAGGAADFGVVPVENSTEGVVARSLDLFLTTPLAIIGETSLFVRHNLLQEAGLARRHHRGVCASASAGAVPQLAVQPPAQRRAPAGRQQRRRRADGVAGRGAGGHRQRARSQRVRLARGGTGDPGRPPQPHPFCHRHAGRSPPPTAGFGPRLHQPGGVGGQPARARCTTCWCR